MIVVLEVFPAIEPGLIVQFPAGRLFKITVPFGSAHVGWVIIPTAGADGTGLTVAITAVLVNVVHEPDVASA